MTLLEILRALFEILVLWALFYQLYCAVKDSRAAAILAGLMATVILGYFLLDALWGWGALGGGAAFVLGIGGVVAYDRLVARKQNTVYTIVGFAHKLDT